jgi:hypothetical protein
MLLAKDCAACVARDALRGYLGQMPKSERARVRREHGDTDHPDNDYIVPLTDGDAIRFSGWELYAIAGDLLP